MELNHSQTNVTTCQNPFAYNDGEAYLAGLESGQALTSLVCDERRLEGVGDLVDVGGQGADHVIEGCRGCVGVVRSC